MTVGELIERLNKYHTDLPVVQQDFDASGTKYKEVDMITLRIKPFGTHRCNNCSRLHDEPTVLYIEIYAQELSLA